MEKNRMGSVLLGSCLIAATLTFSGGAFEKAFAEEIVPIEAVSVETEEAVTAGAEDGSGTEMEEKSASKLYGEILRQYERVWRENPGMDQYSEESLVNYLLYMGYGREDAQLVFSLTDLDGNGIEELVMGLAQAGALESVSLLELFTAAEGSPIHLLDSGERWSFQICEGGFLSENGSGGAAHNYQSYLKIGADGKSCEVVEYYYVNGDEQTVEDVEGNIQPFDGNYEQYLKRYPQAKLEWKILDEQAIADLAGDPVSLEDMTAEDIVEAPRFRNGRCSNVTEVVANYYLRNWGYEKYSHYWFNQDYLEEEGEKDYFSIQDTVSGETVSNVVIDCHTGNAQETKADGTVLEYAIF